jgi:hypothetical protein
MIAFRSLLGLGLLIIVPAYARGDLHFAAPAVDLGALRGGPVYEHRFEFANDSTEPLEIVDIRLGCGCLQPVLDRRLYQPGEKGVLLLRLRTLGQPAGQRTWNAQVQYRQGTKTGEVTLMLGASIRNEVTVEPSILAMSIETALGQVVTITDHRPAPLKVINVLASSPAIRVKTEAEGKNVTRVRLEVRGAELSANRQEEMLNIYTDDPGYRHLQVPITLMKASRLTVSATPEHVEIHGTGSKLVRLRAEGDRKITVERADADHAAVKCTWASGPGNDATLKVAVDGAGLKSTDMKINVRIQLREPVAAMLTIPVILIGE